MPKICQNNKYAERQNNMHQIQFAKNAKNMTNFSYQNMASRGCRASKKKNKSPCSSHCCLAAMQRGIIHDLQCSSLVFQNSEIISGGRLPIRAPAGCCPQQGLLELLLAKNRQNTCKICKIWHQYAKYARGDFAAAAADDDDPHYDLLVSGCCSEPSIPCKPGWPAGPGGPWPGWPDRAVQVQVC